MKQKFRIYICLLLSLVFLLSLSCKYANNKTNEPSATITDQLGREVKLDNIPQRIISLAPNNTEILYALGLANRVIAVTDYDDYPPEVKQKSSIGGFSTPNIEKIISLSPDLVLATNIHKQEIIPNLEQRGIKVVALAPSTIEDVLEAIRLVGKITDKESEASNLIMSMQNRIEKVTNSTRNLTQLQKKRVLYLIWNDPLITVGANSLEDDIIIQAGGTNIVQNLNGYPTITLESVLQADPEVIIAGVSMGNGNDKPYQFVMNESRLRNAAARQNNRIYSIDLDLAGRAGPRIVDTLEQFAVFIHPELFKVTR
jgi:iron complex transport system substrate-binding protein